jgi:two-component system response regulator
MNEAAAHPILLVEDRPDDVLLTRRAFARAGFGHDLVVLTDGAAAIAALFGGPAAAPTPALVLLDINLPKVGGLDLLRRIRSHERTGHLPVVMLTTSAERCDIAESYRLGANGFVRKPVSYRDFAEAVRILGAYWLTVNVPCPPASAGGRR